MSTGAHSQEMGGSCQYVYAEIQQLLECDRVSESLQVSSFDFKNNNAQCTFSFLFDRVLELNTFLVILPAGIVVMTNVPNCLVGYCLIYVMPT